MDVLELVNRIFRQPVQPVKSIQVSFDGMENTRELFETLLTIFTEGMKIHFGNNGIVDLNTITLSQFKKIVDYFASIGILLHFFKFHIKQLEIMENNNKHTDYIHYSYTLYNPADTYIETDYPDTPTPELFIHYKKIDSNHIIDYKFQIRVMDTIYVVFFQFI